MNSPIVFVTDNVDVLDQFKTACEVNEVSNPVMTFDSGSDLLASLQSTNKLPALILLDLSLPSEAGYDLLSSLKTNTLLRKIPVIMLADTTDRECINHAYQLGVNSYISKPTTQEEYSHIIDVIQSYWLRYNHTVKATSQLLML